MKIYDVISESLDIKKLPDGSWGVVDTATGNLASNVKFDSPGAAEEARDKMKPKSVRKVAPKKAVAKKAVAKKSTSSDMKLGPGDARSNAPGYDQLNSKQKRELAKTGKVAVGGTNYSRNEIDRASQKVPYSGQIPSDKKDTATKSKAQVKLREPSTAAVWFKRLLKVLLISKIGWLNSLLQTAWSASEAEEELDRFARIANKEAAKVVKEAIATNPQLPSNGKNGQFFEHAGYTWKFIVNPKMNLNGWYPQVGRNEAIELAWVNTVKSISETLLVGIVGLLVGAVTGGLSSPIAQGIKVLPGMAKVVAWIGLLAAGGAFATFGTQWLYDLVEDSIIGEKINELLAKHWLNIDYIANLAHWANTEQEKDSAQSMGLGDDPIFGESESVNESASLEIATTFEKQFKDFIKSKPKLMKAYQRGKQKKRS